MSLHSGMNRIALDVGDRVAFEPPHLVGEMSFKEGQIMKFHGSMITIVVPVGADLIFVDREAANTLPI